MRMFLSPMWYLLNKFFLFKYFQRNTTQLSTIHLNRVITCSHRSRGLQRDRTEDGSRQQPRGFLAYLPLVIARTAKEYNTQYGQYTIHNDQQYKSLHISHLLLPKLQLSAQYKCMAILLLENRSDRPDLVRRSSLGCTLLTYQPQRNVTLL